MSQKRDTSRMLRECNSGIIMGASAIEKVLPRVKDKALAEALTVAKNTHKELGDETHGLLLSSGSDTSEAHRLARLMSDVKIGARMLVFPTDSAVASLMTDGCNMGIKSLYRYLNKYKNADQRSRSIAKRLIASEEYLNLKLRDYL